MLILGLGTFAIVMWCLMVYNEIKQICSSKHWYRYFSNFWNWADLTALSLTIFVFICGMIENEVSYISYETLRVLAAIACFCIVLKAFDWMRLFEGTAFYILLVKTTILDIGAFMVVLMFSFILFGMPLGFLNMNRTEDTSFIDGVFGLWVFDSVFNQYLLGLGEFGMDNYQGEYEQAPNP